MGTDIFDNIYVNDPQLGADGSGTPRVQKFDTHTPIQSYIFVL